VFLASQDPEGVLGSPQGGHIARLEFRRRLERDSKARDAFERQVREEQERRRKDREVHHHHHHHPFVEQPAGRVPYLTLLVG
jgi:hypothetical protein